MYGVRTTAADPPARSPSCLAGFERPRRGAGAFMRSLVLSALFLVGCEIHVVRTSPEPGPEPPPPAAAASSADLEPAAPPTRTRDAPAAATEAPGAPGSGPGESSGGYYTHGEMVSALAKPITSPSGHDAACATLSAHTASVRQQRDAEDKCKGLPSYAPCAMSTRLGDLSEELRKLETERVSNACSPPPPPPGESCAEIEAELKLIGRKLSADRDVCHRRAPRVPFLAESPEPGSGG